MCGVVVDDAVDVQVGAHSGVELAQEREELLVAMTRLAARERRTVEHVERSEQRGGCRGACSRACRLQAFDVAKPQGQLGCIGCIG